MSHNTKNYKEPGGDKIVVGGEIEIIAGGKLKVSDGALVEGLQTEGYTLPSATEEAIGGVKKAASQADSTAATVDDLKTAFNGLLAKLRTAGILSAE
jgi:uncharacterized protein YegP (UPF0339 family)